MTMLRTWFRENRLLVTISWAILASLAIAVILYGLFGHQLIKAMYEGRSVGLLNKFVSKQASYSLGRYIEKADAVFLGGAICVLMFVLIVILVTLRSKQYLILSAAIMTLMLFHMINGHWGSDFWEHSAVVRELATHPLSPMHPQILTDAPHEYYSPYSLGVGLISRIFNIGPIAALSAVGLLNLALFLAGLKILVSLLLGNGRTSFYTLLFTLFLWGSSPWGYSGFFHLRILGCVLPYPSTFAMALVFFSLSITILYLRDGNKNWLLPLLAFSVITLITHPLSAIVLYTGIAAIAAGCRPNQRRNYPDYIFLASVVPMSFLIASAWPYYPFIKFILFKGDIYHLANKCMYMEVFQKTWPALIGLPLLALRFKSDRRDGLVLFFLGLLLIYVYGGISGSWSYGRVIYSMMLILHMSIADWLSRNEYTLIRPRLQSLAAPFKYICTVLTLVLALALVCKYAAIFINCVPVAGKNSDSEDYLFLSRYTKQYEVVLSDMMVSNYVPAFGGKVVANSRFMAFVKDRERRENDVKRFFNPTTSLADRKEIIERYGANFLLINKANFADARLSLESFEYFGKTVYADRKFILIKIR